MQIFTATIGRGTDRVITGRVTKPDGSNWDLTNPAVVDIRFLVKRNLSVSDAGALITKTLGAGIAFTSDGTDGAITITLSAADTPSSLFASTRAYPCGLRGYWPGTPEQVEDLIDNTQSTLTVTAGSVQATN